MGPKSSSCEHIWCLKTVFYSDFPKDVIKPGLPFPSEVKPVVLHKKFLWTCKIANLCITCSVTQLCPVLCDLICSTSGFLVLHHLPELAQTHRVSDAIQPSHPLLPPSPPAFSLSQQQGLFQWVSSSHQVAKGLELRRHQSFQWIFRVGFLQVWLVWSSCSPRDSQESSPVTTV